jgi:hypothetical protein
VLAGLQSLFFDSGSRFPAMVYFINTPATNQTKFAVPYFNMFDPRFPGDPVAVRGGITFKFADVKAFVAMHSLVDLDMDKFTAKIKSACLDFVQSAMMDIMKHNQMAGYPLIQINLYRCNVRAIIEDDLKRSLLGTYGVTLTELNITAIELDGESEGYGRLAKLTKDIQETKIETQADLSRRGMEDQYEMNKANLERTSQINLTTWRTRWQRAERRRLLRRICRPKWASLRYINWTRSGTSALPRRTLWGRWGSLTRKALFGGRVCQAGRRREVCRNLRTSSPRPPHRRLTRL